MTPLYFGTGPHRLFAMYAPARPGGRHRRAVVICPPWGDEYLCSHRAIRQLAHGLAAVGVDVLRFDYFGTGDSAGEIREASLAGWQDDIEAALDELRDMAGTARVGVIGLRLGATLAASLLARKPGIAESLGLWDPVACGEDYLRELERMSADAPGVRGSPGGASTAPGACLEVNGFVLTPPQAREIAALDLQACVAKLEVPVRAVVSGSEAARDRLQSMLAQDAKAGAGVDFVPSQPIWLNDANYRPGAVPVNVLRRLTEWFA